MGVREGLAHGANAEVARSPGRGGLSMVRFHAALGRDVEAGSPACRLAKLSTPRLSISPSTRVGTVVHRRSVC
jgi:hypothetical protein